MKLIQLLLLTVLFASSVLAEEYRFKIGAILPFTGSLGHVGPVIEQSIRAELKNYPEQIHVIYEDSKTLDYKHTINAANKLVSIDKVDLIIVMFIDEVKLLNEFSKRKKIPLVSLWDSDQELFNNNPYLYSVGMSLKQEMSLVAKTLLKNTQNKKVAVINQNFYWSQEIAKKFKIEAKKSEAKIVYAEGLDPEQNDFKDIILNLRKLKPDFLFFSFTPNVDVFVKQLRLYGIEATMYAPQINILDGVNLLSKKHLEGIYFTSPAYLDTQHQELDSLYYLIGQHGIRLVLEKLARAKPSSLVEDLEEFRSGNNFIPPKLFQFKEDHFVAVENKL